MTLSLAEARALHEEVPVIDLHADTPMLVQVTGYDPNIRHTRKLPKRANLANALGRPAYGRGSEDQYGLTDIGRDVIAEMQRCGVIADLAHINRRGFYDALDELDQPPIVSHTGLAGVHPHWRNIDDAQIRAVADAGGCIGIIFSRRFLGGKGIDKLCDHLVHLINVAGENVPALGSDFDGFVVPPDGLEDISLVPYLTKALSERGLSNTTLKKLLGNNALRVLDEVPPSFEVRHKPVPLKRPT